MKTYYVYILASASRRLYVGMTSNLVQRMYQHKTKQFKGFTARYNINKLIYFEDFAYVYDAMDRERQLRVGRDARRSVSSQN